MPAPPPAGESSTVRCLFVEKSRMSTAPTSTAPDARARPRIDPSSTDVSISGNSVSTLILTRSRPRQVVEAAAGAAAAVAVVVEEARGRCQHHALLVRGLHDGVDVRD